MKLYLAGPMTGRAEFNRPTFDAAARAIRVAGHHVFSPVDYATSVGFDFTGTTGSPNEAAAQGFNLREALAVELSWICRHAEGVVLLPDWQISSGVAAELATGHALGLPVWEFAQFSLRDTNSPLVERGAS